MKKLLFTLSLLSLLGAAAIGIVVMSWYHSEFPDVSDLNRKYPVVHYHGQNRPFTVSIQKLRPAGWVRFQEVSKLAVGAIVVSEDWAFYQHKGYDPAQIREAIQQDWEEKAFTRGASTITQQVVRNVFLSQDKNLWRKLKELYLAVELERVSSKRRILESYLNIAEWGEGIFGIRSAARFYFSKSPAELTAKEGAFLAMLLPSPKRYSQSFRQRLLTDYARETMGSILDKMVQARYLTEDERGIEAGILLSFEQGVPAQAPAVHYGQKIYR